MFKTRFPHPLTLLRRSASARTSARLPKIAQPRLPALWTPPAPRLVPVVLEAENDVAHPKSGFVL